MAKASSSLPFLAPDKLAFLLTLVPYLIDRGVASVTEIAKDFGVTPQYVRGIARFLGTAGIPGETSTYQDPDLFDIDWDALEQHDEVVLRQYVGIDDVPRFSGTEAAALLAGLQYLSALPNVSSHGNIELLMRKLRSGAVHQRNTVAIDSPASDTSLSLVQQALAGQVQMNFAYRTASGDTVRRTVDPLELVSSDDRWYVRGWCHLREAVRLFRIDRMSGLEITSVPVDQHPLSEDGYHAFFDPREDHEVVTLAATDTGLSLIQDYQPEIVGPEEKAGERTGRTLVTLRVTGYAGICHLALTHIDQVEVIAPPLARESIARWAREALGNYSD
ncbi:WYL domain-containing protein [Lysinibacter sp. HNR]|uniref:helix-turn-helix transcriptional regulator n=1 Tax=Lysinibacter sp. HNR TaxID=3031408 RepID=UPI0024350B32|nr:WYL domain-containing protein [Lysinibacter sp. HNR]WGD36219.1 WYL domain-containing protein [Lysinibacter sp. HNR]